MHLILLNTVENIQGSGLLCKSWQFRQNRYAQEEENAFGHGAVQADGKISKAADCWYFDVTVGTSSLRNHLQNGALDDLDMITLGLAISKLRRQYNDRCLGGPLED